MLCEADAGGPRHVDQEDADCGFAGHANCDCLATSIPVAIFNPRYHINLAWHGRELDPAFQASLVVPAMPSRGWDVVLPPASRPPVPPVIPAWKGKAALREAGLLDSVEAAVEVAGGRIADAWAGAPEWSRDSEFLSDLALTLGLTDMEIDHMFLVAARIRS